MSKRNCDTCKHCYSSAYDDVFCGHPEVRKRMPYGQSLISANTIEECPAPEYPLWKKREK